MSITLTNLTLDRLAPWLTSTTDPAGDHAVYLSAIAAMGEQLFSLIWDQGDPDDSDYVPGWGQLTDVDLCPTAFLPFLAQLVGSSIPTGTTDADARAIIRAEAGQQRGTPAAIVAAATRFLAGGGTPTLFERTAADGSTPDAYHFCLVVLAADAQTVNIIPNPSFGHDTVGSAPAAWSPIAMATFLVASVGGVQQLHCTTNSLASASEAAVELTGTTISGTANCIAMDPGDVITVVAAAIINSIPATAQVYTQVSCLNTAGAATAVFESAMKANAAGTFTFSDAWTAPANTVKAQVFLTIVSGAASTVVDLDLTHYMMVINPLNGAIPAYFDGDTPGHVWLGTPGDSSSASSVQPLVDAVDAVKPAGVQWTLIQTSTWTIAEFEAAYSTITLAEAAFPTISNLETDLT